MKKKILLAVVLAISVFVVKSQTKRSKELRKEIINLSDTSFLIKEINKKGVIIIEGTLSSSNPEIKEGEFISIMGPSGSGKSILMNSILSSLGKLSCSFSL